MTSKPAARALVFALALGACARAQRAPALASPEPPRTVPEIALHEPLRSASPTWTLLPPDTLPVSVTALGALSDDRVVAVAGGAAFVLDAEGRARALCPGVPTPPGGFDALGLAESDGRVVLVAGTPADPIVWVTRTEPGAVCQGLEVPGLMVRNATPGRLGVSLDGARVAVWSVGGALVAGDLSGRLVRLPVLPHLVMATPVGPRVYALTRMGPTGRHRLWTLDPEATTWTPVPGGDDLHAPVALAPGPGGAVLGLDARRRFAASPSGLSAVLRLPGVLRRDDGLVTLSPAGALVSMRSGLLWAREGVVGLPALPSLLPPVALAVTGGGVRWVSDGREVFRAGPAPDAGWAEVTRRPLLQRRVAAFAAAGESLLVVAPEGAAALSRDRGARWSRALLPGESLPVLAGALSAEGVAGVVSPRALSLFDDGHWVTRPLPPRSRRGASHAVGLYALGHRWILVDGVVLSSDDDGQTWDLRFGELPEPSAPPDDPPAETAPRAMASTLAPDGSLVLLDDDQHLWRSDDGAAHFVRLGDERLPSGISGFHAPPRIAAFGSEVVQVHRGVLSSRSDPSLEAPFVPTFLGFSAGGQLVAGASHEARGANPCRGPQGDVLLVRSGLRWLPIFDACAHGGLAFARDGDVLVVLRPDGATERVSLTELADHGPGHRP